MKFIFILRDPVYRALSAWNMYHYVFFNHHKFSKHYDSRSFKTAIEAEIITFNQDDWYSNRVSYVKRGVYYDQLLKYQKFFHKENILIIEHNELINQFCDTISLICKFLNIPEQALVNKKANEGIVLDYSAFQEQINLLKEFYKPYNKKLFELIQKEYDW